MKERLEIKTREMLVKVIRENLNYLVRFASIRLGNRAEAEDVVYEAVCRFLEIDPSKIKINSMRMYLFRIVYNLCLDYYSSGKVVRRLTEEDYEMPDITTEEELYHEEINRLNGLLEKLPEREAEIVRMNVMDELSFVEISQLISTPVSTVKSRFKSGMDKLRKQFFNK